MINGTGLKNPDKMETENLKRFDRIVAILIQLQSKKVVKAHELAMRFQVSLRTIYRDIRSLEVAGVPLYGEAGTGYSLVDGYRLPPIMFTRQEAGSFVAAEKLMQHFTDQNLKSYFDSAMFKIKSVLRNTEKDWIADLHSQISIHSDQTTFNEAIPNALELFFESLAKKNQVAIHYQKPSQDRSELRQIEPVGLFYENRHWYIMGYCHLREDYRQFRLDRIQEISRTEKGFTRSHGTVEDLLKQPQNVESKKVRLLVDKEIIAHLEYDRHYYGFVSEKEVEPSRVEMLFNSQDIQEGFPRWFLMFGDCAEILEPEELKIRVNEILSEIKKRLNS